MIALQTLRRLLLASTVLLLQLPSLGPCSNAHRSAACKSAM